MSDRTLSEGDVEAIVTAIGKHSACQVFSDKETAGLKILSRVLSLAERSVVSATVISIVGICAAAFGYGVVVLVKMATVKVFP